MNFLAHSSDFLSEKQVRNMNDEMLELWYKLRTEGKFIFPFTFLFHNHKNRACAPKIANYSLKWLAMLSTCCLICLFNLHLTVENHTSILILQNFSFDRFFASVNEQQRMRVKKRRARFGREVILMRLKDDDILQISFQQNNYPTAHRCMKPIYSSTYRRFYLKKKRYHVVYRYTHNNYLY